LTRLGHVVYFPYMVLIGCEWSHAKALDAVHLDLVDVETFDDSYSILLRPRGGARCHGTCCKV
jgi:hypothetical protein